MRLILLFCLLAFAGQASALSTIHQIGLWPRKTPQPTDKPVMNVVLVHGIFETGYSWRQLRDRLAKQNVHCLVARLKPSNGRLGIDHLAGELQKQIDAEFGKNARVSIVGFSMGGLVSRYYLQEMGGAKRCDRLITISTPHKGSNLAWCMYGKGAWQMRPGSSFLKQLERSESKLGSMPVSSLRTPLDLVVIPSNHSIWSRAENRSYWVSLHPMMLTNHRVLGDVEKELMGKTLSAR